MAAWRTARSIDVLVEEMNGVAPNRSKASDGTIGDAGHQREPSDHNPNPQNVVCAVDITHDPANGADMGPISEYLNDHQPPALKYLIFNRRISGRHTGWRWLDYTGASPHTEHLHVSVGIGEDGQSTGPYDDTSPWGIANAVHAGPNPPPPPPPPEQPPPPPPPGQPLPPPPPDQPPPPGQPGSFQTWGTDVRVHSAPSVHAPVVRTLPGPTPVHVAYQVHAEAVIADGFTNDAWSFVPDLGGFLSNIYIDTPAPWLPGVPEGGQTPPPPPPAPPPGPQPGNFRTWGSDVRVHSKPSVQSSVVRTLPGPTPIHVAYQVHGEEVRADGYTNNAWSFVPDLGGFLSNIYIDTPAPWLPGVPEGGGGQAPPPPPQQPPPGGLPEVDGLSQEQLHNAKIIIDVGRHFGFPDQALVIALATAMQESKLKNLAGGDRDSVGLFQQRPSQGWGTVEQCHDPVLATEAFYGVAGHTRNRGLKQVPNWEHLPVTVAAQQVQRSGYPDAYAKWERQSHDLVAALH